MSAKRKAEILGHRLHTAPLVDGGELRPSPLDAPILSVVGARRPADLPKVDVLPDLRRLDSRGRFFLSGLGSLLGWSGSGPLDVALEGPWLRFQPATTGVRDLSRDVARFDGRADRVSLPRGLRTHLGGLDAGSSVLVWPVPSEGRLLVANPLAVIALPHGVASGEPAAPIAAVLPLITTTKETTREP